MSNRYSDSIIGEKIRRLEQGAQPRVLDFFAGCGGLSLGFVTAGCRSIGGVEADREALRTFAFNFHRDDQAAHLEPRQVEWDAHRLLGAASSSGFERAVDIVTGGPPCPTFTRIGRAKLRDLKQRGFLEEDTRGGLYEHFIRRVGELKPLAVVMENVPEFLNHQGANLGLDASRRLHDLGYAPAYTLLNAAAYGVPQWRERFFLVAVHKQLGIDRPAFPARSNDTSSMPVGVEMTRKAAMARLDRRAGDGQMELFNSTWWSPPPAAGTDLPPPVTVDEALSDLPIYVKESAGAMFRKHRYWDAEDVIPYAANPGSAYARLMRSWPGLESIGGIAAHHHLCRRTTTETGRDAEIFRRMEPGAEYPRAIQIANENFERRRAEAEEAAGAPLAPEELDRLRSQCIPPYDDGKFPNKWWKLVPSTPSRTLTAHLSKDSYSHIHHDGSQERMITVQEAARLQSFPDSFVFKASMNSAFRQIGNSVPPLLSWHIAGALLRQVEEAAGANFVADLPGPVRHA